MFVCDCTANQGPQPVKLFAWGGGARFGGQALINFVTEHRGRLFQLGSRFGRCKRVDIRGGLVF
jgi:hypothetical protein